MTALDPKRIFLCLLCRKPLTIIADAFVEPDVQMGDPPGSGVTRLYLECASCSEHISTVLTLPGEVCPHAHPQWFDPPEQGVSVSPLVEEWTRKFLARLLSLRLKGQEGPVDLDVHEPEEIPSRVWVIAFARDLADELAEVVETVWEIPRSEADLQVARAIEDLVRAILTE